jgi:hypothetical protein
MDRKTAGKRGKNSPAKRENTGKAKANTPQKGGKRR